MLNSAKMSLLASKSGLHLMETLPEKRAKMRKQERVSLLARLRHNLPVLTKTEVRRFRLTYYEALMEEIDDSGFTNTSQYIRNLVKYQKKYKEEFVYDLMIQSLPMLQTDHEELDVLHLGLKQSEESVEKGDIQTATCEFLRLGEHFGLNSKNWLWLAEQLFSQALALCNDYTEDEGYLKALACYVYGNYLNKQKIDFDKSISFLNLARDICIGKEWTAIAMYKVHTKPLFILICTLLYEILYEISDALVLSDPQEALATCKIAKERVREACLPRADIYYLQGRCEFEVDKPMNAVIYFLKAYRLYKSINENEKLCETRIQLALAYLQIDDWKNSYKFLKELLEYAQQNNLHTFEGRAYLYIGQYYLNQGMPERATSLLLQALEIFHELNEVNNREFVSNLAAVSSGLENIPKYIKLILKCEFATDVIAKSAHLLNLIAWKDSRIHFWESLSESESEVVSYKELTQPAPESETSLEDESISEETTSISDYDV